MGAQKNNSWRLIDHLKDGTIGAITITFTKSGLRNSCHSNQTLQKKGFLLSFGLFDLLLDLIQIHTNSADHNKIERRRENRKLVRLSHGVCANATSLQNDPGYSIG